jgi:hypothetical protein
LLGHSRHAVDIGIVIINIFVRENFTFKRHHAFDIFCGRKQIVAYHPCHPCHPYHQRTEQPNLTPDLGHQAASLRAQV